MKVDHIIRESAQRQDTCQPRESSCALFTATIIRVNENIYFWGKFIELLLLYGSNGVRVHL